METNVTAVVRQLVPFFIPNAGVHAPSKTKNVESVQRYALRVIGNKGVLPGSRSFEESCAVLKALVKQQGNDVGGFSGLLRQVPAALGEEQARIVLDKMATICGDMEQIARASMSRAADGSDGAASRMSSLSFVQPLERPGASLAGMNTMPDPVMESAAKSAQPSMRDAAEQAYTVAAPSSLAEPLVALAQAALRPTDGLLEANEELVQDVLHACQGISGRFVVFPGGDGDELSFTDDAHARLSNVQKCILMHLCELGWQYRCVRRLALPSGKHVGAAASGGLLHQAFSAAIVHQELKEFYRLMAVLQSMALQTAQLGAAEQSDSYLTPRRLVSWLADPLRRMRLLASLSLSCQGARGGQLASIVHGQAFSGDLFRRGYALRLLRHVCVPLVHMIHEWIYEGKLNDPYGDFFVVDGSAAAGDAADLWHDRYRLQRALLPTFISEGLAAKILRAGKSINFLRQQCDDLDWVQENAQAAARSRRAALQLDQSRSPVEMLQPLVDTASARVDARLKGIMLDAKGFRRHCLALKQYLLFSQGDFVSALLHQVSDVLCKPASEVGELELSIRLKKAMYASNSQYHEDDVQDRLCVKSLAAPGRDTLGWDVFCLRYQVAPPLSTLLNGRIMKRYEQISTFLWKIKHVEFVLQQVWLVLRKMGALIQRTLRAAIPSSHKVWLMLREAHRLHSDMTNFCQNLQTYIMYEVLEGAWTRFCADLDAARDIDEVIEAHEAYLVHITQQALMDEQTASLRATLGRIFACCHSILPPLTACSADVQTQAAVFVAHQAQAGTNMAGGSWGAGENPVPQLFSGLCDSAVRALQAVRDTAEQYNHHLKTFTAAHIKDANHLDLRFLMMRIDFTEYHAAHA